MVKALMLQYAKPLCLNWRSNCRLNWRSQLNYSELVCKLKLERRQAKVCTPTKTGGIFPFSAQLLNV